MYLILNTSRCPLRIFSFPLQVLLWGLILQKHSAFGLKSWLLTQPLNLGRYLLKRISSNITLLLAPIGFQVVLKLPATLRSDSSGIAVYSEPFPQPDSTPGWSTEQDLWASVLSSLFSYLSEGHRTQNADIPSQTFHPGLPPGSPSSHWSLDLWLHQVLSSSNRTTNTQQPATPKSTPWVWPLYCHQRLQSVIRAHYWVLKLPNSCKRLQGQDCLLLGWFSFPWGPHKFMTLFGHD